MKSTRGTHGQLPSLLLTAHEVGPSPIHMDRYESACLSLLHRYASHLTRWFLTVTELVVPVRRQFNIQFLSCTTHDASQVGHLEEESGEILEL